MGALQVRFVTVRAWRFASGAFGGVGWDDNRRHIVPMGLWSCVDPGGSAPVPLINQPEIDMSADKDRGIRREKQKRAKELKRQAKQQKQGTPEQSTSKG